MYCNNIVKKVNSHHPIPPKSARIHDIHSRVMPYTSCLKEEGEGGILYVKESIQANEIKLQREADFDEAVFCKIFSGNSKLSIGLVYRSPNINEEDNTKIQCYKGS